MNDRITEFDRLLEAKYTDVKCGLDAGGSPFKLLIMSILSAQCTDKRVNIVSEKLFERFPTASDFAQCDILELEQYIKTCGLYHAKAANIKKCCTMLVNEFEGIIPSDMDELLKLPGVGRKIANLIRGDVFMLGGIVADTHLIRITNRLSFANSTDPHKVEKSITPLIPTERQSDFCHRVVVFGREICSARAPKCDACFVKEAGICNGI